MERFKPKNENYQEAINEVLKGQFFMKHINFHLSNIEPGRIEGQLSMEQLHLQQHHFVHGGVVAAVADIVMGFAAYTLVEVNKGVVTSDLRISFLRPGLGDILVAQGYVIKQGNLLSFCESEIFMIDEGVQTLVAKSSSTMVTIDQKHK